MEDAVRYCAMISRRQRLCERLWTIAQHVDACVCVDYRNCEE